MNRYILLSYTVLTNMTETIQVLFCKTNHKCTLLCGSVMNPFTQKLY